MNELHNKYKINTIIPHNLLGFHRDFWNLQDIPQQEYQDMRPVELMSLVQKQSLLFLKVWESSPSLHRLPVPSHQQVVETCATDTTSVQLKQMSQNTRQNIFPNYQQTMIDWDTFY